MKIFNLTDVPTDELQRRSLCDQTIVVGNKAIAPGACEEVSDEYRTLTMAAVAQLVSVGAVAVNELPPQYALAKSKAPMKQKEEKAEEIPPPPPTSPQLHKKTK